MIQHVALEVARADVSECVAFYALLGFRQVDPPESLRDRAAWLESDRTQIHLLFSDDPHVLPQGHVAVVVQEYEPVLASLRAEGYDYDRRAEHWGSPRAYVRDPAGNLVELMEFPPPSA